MCPKRSLLTQADSNDTLLKIYLFFACWWRSPTTEGPTHRCLCLLAITIVIDIAIAITIDIDIAVATIAIAANAGPTAMSTDAAVDTDAIDVVATNAEATVIVVTRDSVAINVVTSCVCSAPVAISIAVPRIR